MSTPVVCLSAGLAVPKKTDNPIARQHLYLNYGLLGLASILAEAGHSASVVHGHFDSPEEVVERLLAERLLPGPHPLLLSIPSSFALPWARRVCRAVRRSSPSTTIVVGGRWVVADDEAWIRGQLPDVNQFVPGLADGIVETIVSRRARRSLLFRPVSLAARIPTLNYYLLDRWQDFHPSLEVSRGCGMHCTFCAEAEEPLQNLKEPRRLADEFDGLARMYGSGPVHPYLEASLFRPTTSWIEAFKRGLHEVGVSLPWRTETRVDVLSPQQIASLAEAGLRVLDLGLESASPAQLLRMKKTTQPAVYLRRASQLLRACKSANVWAKVNILLHPGETEDTIRETTDWLDAHRALIKGLSVGPTILFRYGRATEAVLREFQQHGASAVDPGSLDAKGFAHLHLSTEMPHDRAVAVSHEVSRRFMSDRDYYDLKSFSYLPRRFTWDQFRALVESHPSSEYPFRVSNPDMERDEAGELKIDADGRAAPGRSTI